MQHKRQYVIKNRKNTEVAMLEYCDIIASNRWVDVSKDILQVGEICDERENNEVGGDYRSHGVKL